MQNLELWFSSKESSLSVRSFSVVEEMSSLFDVSVIALSPHEDLDLDAFLGHGAGLRAAGTPGWSGVVSHMEQVGVEPGGMSTYYVRIVPALFRTTQRRNCRIFQHLSVPEIATALLAEWEIAPEMELDPKSFPALEYRVQYGETDFAFLSRLLEEAGISYFFHTPDGAPTNVVLSAEPAGREPRPGLLTYINNLEHATRPDVVTHLKLIHDARPGRLTVRDYDFRGRPDFALLAEARAAATMEERHELYQYLPGAFLVEPGGAARTDEKEGKALAQRRLDGARQGRRRVAFRTTALDLAPGSVFSIDGHPRRDLDKDRRLCVVERRLEGTSDGEWSSDAQAVFVDDPYRPALRTPKPRIAGVQSALVVGPEGEEIHTDEHGRVRVQFHWDREGKFDDKSSCWIRVSQGWAGRGFGHMALPRVGQEVLVDFFEGDPDQPVVVGRVYNSVARAPYKLPEHKTKTSWKSDSYPGSGGFNELTFDDAAGQEKVFLHAQKDLVRVTREAESVTIGASLETVVGASETRKVGADQTIEIKEGRTTRIGKADVVVVGDEYRIQIGSTGATFTEERVVFSTGKASITITGGDIFFDASGSIKVAAGAVASVGGAEVHIDGGPNVLLNTAGLSPPVPMALIGEGLGTLGLVLDEVDKSARSFVEPLFDELPGGFDEVALENNLKDLVKAPPLPDAAPGYLMMPQAINDQLREQMAEALKTPGLIAAELKDRFEREKEKLEKRAAEIKARAGEMVEDVKGKIKGTVEDLRARAEAAKQQAQAKFEELKGRIEAVKAEARAKLDELKGRFEKLKAEAQAKVEEIKGRIEAAKAQIQNKVAELRQKAQAKLDELKHRLEEVKAQAKAKLDEIKAKIEDVKAQAKAKIDEFKARIEALKEQAKAKFEEMKKQAKEIVDQAKEQLEAARARVQELKQRIEDAREQVKAKVAEVKGQIEEIKGQVKAKIEELKNEAKAAIDKVKSVIEDTKQEAKAALEEVKSEAKALFNDAKSTVHEAKALFKDAKQGVKDLGKEAKQAWNDVKHDAKDAWKDVKGEAKEAWKDAKQDAKEMGKEAKEAWKDVKQDAKDTWKDIKGDGTDALKEAKQQTGQATDELGKQMYSQKVAPPPGVGNGSPGQVPLAPGLGNGNGVPGQLPTPPGIGQGTPGQLPAPPGIGNGVPANLQPPPGIGHGLPGQMPTPPAPGEPMGAIMSRSGGFTGNDVASALNDSKGATIFQSPGEGQLLVMKSPSATPISPSELSSHLVDSQMNGVPTTDAFAEVLGKKGYVVYERPWGEFGEAFVRKGAPLAMEAV